MPNPEDFDRIEQQVRRSEARNKAVAAVLEDRPLLGATYEVWGERLDTGAFEPRAGGFYGLPKKAAMMTADGYNEEEADNARGELREVNTRYVVMKATTTYTVEED